MSPRKEALLAAVLTLAALLLFTGKAFHVDDTLFLKAARQIRANPFDFYGFSVNWYGTEQPMSTVTQNPPLGSYFLALASLVAGWNETAIHAVFLLPALAAALGTYALARRLTVRPAIATFAALATPAFLVSSTNVMCDTLLLAFWVWAIERWVHGIESARAGPLIAASLLIAFASLTKYFGITLIPLLLAYGIARRGRIGAWALALLVPVAALVAYQLGTQSLYGHGLLSGAANYSSAVRFRRGGFPGSKTLIGLSFAGGSLATVAFFGPWLWKARALGAAALVGGILATVLGAAGELGGHPLAGPTGIRVGTIAQVVTFAAAGLSLLALSAAEIARRREPDTLLLFLWIVGTFVFAVFVNWTINARSFLPAAPAMGILIARRLERVPAGRTRFVPTLALILSAGLALAVATADTVLAGAARTAAERISATHRSGTLWFEGHWGFQHYMEAAGAKAVDRRRSLISAGDRVVIPVNNTNLFPLPANAVHPSSSFDIRVFPALATLSPEIGAGFYLDPWGPLPIALGRVLPEHYVVLEVARDIPPGEIGR